MSAFFVVLQGLMYFLHRYAYEYEVAHGADTLQMDLIKSNYFTPPIIILQTVMKEVRHRSLPLYSRLKALTTTDERKVWVFYNEFRSDYYRVREDDETPNDWNDRGVRKAAEWYNTHLTLAHPIGRGLRGRTPANVPAASGVLGGWLCPSQTGGGRFQGGRFVRLSEGRAFVIAY
ncbi:uncharacterized protein F5891DRAFT_1246444 [Suillus fuscotomentosus]|uniref:Uncharacterized protein n=1 Tax=Suillus fuscotomentosus TaxID=1912939 RepID=A0AAD4E120_9AGAM|nr:uncharacterized protein F5891DRAFT_1246444 [Suillus fuscotomentosus]KAG1896509.1 hypothetical protein F5891DRAFT_1246444 [Suillus fuscotomentosus]